MEVEKPIPSYAIPDGRKVKIHHAGQRRTCARCQKMADDCPGQSNARLCDQNGGQKAKVDIVWKETLDKVGYTEWLGGKIENPAEENDNESEENWIDIEKCYPNCDGIVINKLVSKNPQQQNLTFWIILSSVTTQPLKMSIKIA